MKRLAPEDALLFALCRQRLNQDDKAQVRQLCDAAIRWDVLTATAEDHGVAPLVASNLLATVPRAPGLTAAVRERLSGRMIRNMALEEQAGARMNDILGFFNAHGIDVMPIKGAAMQLLVYDRPWYTTAWDVDLIVGAAEDELPPRLRAEIGALLTAGPFYVEYNYLTHHDLLTPGGLQLDFRAIFRRSTKVRVGAFAARVMCPEDLLLSACINSCRKRYFRLKALFDVAEIVGTFGDLDWDALAARADEAGCAAIVYAALDTARSTLGCAVPPSALEGLGLHPVRKALIRVLRRRMSFSNLASLNQGRQLLGRQVGPALLLPYATYSPGHVLRGLFHVFRESRLA